MNGSKIALAVVLIATGLVGVVGSFAGTLAAAIAGLIDPSILVQATAGSGGIPPLVPPARNPGEPGGGEGPPTIPGPPGGGTPEPSLPELPSGIAGELPPIL